MFARLKKMWLIKVSAFWCQFKWSTGQLTLDSHPVLNQMVKAVLKYLVELKNHQSGLSTWEDFFFFFLLGKCEGFEGEMNILN